TTVPVSQSAAEKTALKEFLRPLTTKVSAFAVSETDTEWRTPGPDGKLHLKIANRPVWVVLIHSWRVPKNPGTQSNATVRTTLAVSVDAKTGRFLEGVTLFR